MLGTKWVLDWIKDKRTEGTRSLGRMELGLRRQKCPRWTLDCTAVHLGMSKTEGSYRVFKLGTGYPGQLVNQKMGIVTERKAESMGVEGTGEYRVGAEKGVSPRRSPRTGVLDGAKGIEF